MKPIALFLLVAVVVVVATVVVVLVPTSTHLSHFEFREPIVRAEPLDRTTLGPDYNEDWNFKDFIDKTIGISITVDPKKKTDMAWRSSSTVVSENPFGMFDTFNTGFKWHKQINESPNGTVTVLMKKSEPTYKAVIEGRNMNLFLRYIALSNMDDMNFTPDEKLHFLKTCAADRSAVIRMMTIQKAGDYKPPTRTIGILCRALTDPCLSVALNALYPLEKHFLIGNSDVIIDSESAFYFNEPPPHFDEMLHNKIMYVAQNIHKLRPDLVNDADLKLIAGTDK